MEKHLSIVLSVERKNTRKLAQEWYGLTNEQMIDMDVHHNPARHQGGRNIPEHLYVYHHTLHNAVHGDDFTKWARKGGKMGGVVGDSSNGGRASMSEKNEEGKSVQGLKMTRAAHFSKRKDEKSNHAVKMGEARAQQMSEEGYPGLGASFEAASAAGKKAASQRWRCLDTGHVSSAAGLARYQNARNIDTSLRERIG